MDLEVTNRNLLRNFKDLKAKLTTGEYTALLVPQEDGGFLKVTYNNSRSPKQRIIDRITNNPLPQIARPDDDII